MSWPEMYYVGGSQQFAHTERDADGNVLASQAGTWRSSNTAVATIDQSGLAHWVAPGESDLTFVVGDYRNAAIQHVIVHPTAPIALHASPSAVTIMEQGIVRVSLTATDASDNNITDFEITSIVTDDPDVADGVQVSGKEFFVIGLAPGGCQVTVFAGAISTFVTADVLAVVSGISEAEADARYRQLADTIAHSEISEDAPVEHNTLSGTLAIAATRTARKHHVQLNGDLAITVNSLAANDFCFIDAEQDASGGHALSIALGVGLPPLVDDNNVVPQFTQAPNRQDTFMLYNDRGVRVILARTWQNVPTT